MKTLMKWLLPLSLLAACSSKSSISGTYVKTAQSEYSIAHDTLVIAHLSGNNFEVTRKTGFKRKDQHAQYKVRRSTGTFDGAALNMESGLKIVVKDHKLYVGGGIYEIL
jgi:hypothetical protein